LDNEDRIRLQRMQHAESIYETIKQYNRDMMSLSPEQWKLINSLHQKNGT